MNEQLDKNQDWKQFMEESRRQWRIQMIANLGLLALAAGILLLVLRG